MSFSFEEIIKQNKFHFDALRKICINVGEQVEGNCVTPHLNISQDEPLLVPKQKNLFNVSSKCQNILEIGFNAGHSALLFLLSNKESKIVCFDIGIHSYVYPCYQYLNLHFPNRIQLIIGDSRHTLYQYSKENIWSREFDFIHIDGGHDFDVLFSDFFNTIFLTKPNSFIIIDDVDAQHIYDFAMYCVKTKLIKPLSDEENWWLPTYKHPHLCFLKT